MKANHFILILLLAFLVNAGCTSFPMGRHPSTGYSNYSDGDPREVSIRDLSGRHDDFSARSLSPQEAVGSQNKNYRKHLENNLTTSDERKQYIRYRPYLNEQEKIQFLELSDIYSRERWIESKNLGVPADRHSRNISSLIEENDITLGMEKEAVKDSWGDPDYIEVSGNPKFENERWRFSLPIQTPEGYQIEERFVYFESGRVVGWKSR